MNAAATLSVWVQGIGVAGPGLADWPQARAALQPGGHGAWTAQPTVLPAAQRLPPAERRRAGALVRLSVGVAEQACAGADGRGGPELATVFTSSSGDGANCHALCEVLATPERLVSPTRFTNSVHNAAAGYWHIATASQAASTSLCAGDASFEAGLLEAAVQCSAGTPVLLVAADVPYPEPLHAAYPLADAFGVALLLVPAARPGARGLRLCLAAPAAPATPLAGAALAPLEALRRQVSAARALPLLQALAGAGAARLVLGDAASGCGLAIDVAAA